MGKLFLYIISIFWVIIGVLMVFATDMARKKVMNKFLEISDLKKFSPIPIAIGVLLLLAARYNSYAPFVVIMGVLAIAKGVIMIVATEKMEKIIEWSKKAKDNAYKVWGVAVIILGSIILMGIK